MKFLVVFAILAAVATAQPKHHADGRILNIIGGILDHIFNPKEPTNTDPAILPPYDYPEHPIVIEDSDNTNPAILPPYDYPEHPIVIEDPVIPGPAVPPVLPGPVLPEPGVPEPNPLANYSPLVKVIMNIN